jgi:hypothetical protein
MATKTKQPTKSAEFKKLCKQHDVDYTLIPEVKSFEEACEKLGIDPTKLPTVKGLSPRYQKRLIADYKLSVIADALREGKDVDYTDTDKYKYFPVFSVQASEDKPSGFGLSSDYYDGWASVSSVGVRLCFPNRDLAKYFGKQFIELHKDHHLLT